MTLTISTNSSDAVDGFWVEEAVYAAEQSTDDEIVVDMSAIAAVRSAELNQLIRLHLDLKQQGRRLVLQHAQSQVSEIFTLTRLHRLIEIRDPLNTI